MLESKIVTEVVPVSFGIDGELPADPHPVVIPVTIASEMSERVKNRRQTEKEGKKPTNIGFSCRKKPFAGTVGPGLLVVLLIRLS